MEKWIRARFQPGLPLGNDGRRVTAGKEHIALSRRAAWKADAPRRNC